MDYHPFKPGDTLVDMIEERGWDYKKFAIHTELQADVVLNFLNGGLLTQEVLDKLSLFAPKEFWVTREAQYRASLDQCAYKNCLMIRTLRT